MRIIDEDGKLLVRFTGSVIKKEQSSGRLGIGDVVETLVVTGTPKIYIGKKMKG